MKLRDEVLLQMRIRSDTWDKDTLNAIAQLLIALLSITVALLELFYELTIGLVRGLEWIIDTVENAPARLAVWWLSRIRFPVAIG